MKKGIAILIAVLAVIGIIIGIISGSYNGLVNQQEEVENKHSVISVQLQRRADLIPNFVNTVKGYSDYEQKTYTAVTEARNAVAGAKTAGEQTKAAEQLDSAISVWVNAVTEAYPELKSNEHTQKLLNQIEQTENAKLKARMTYSEAAAKYNAKIHSFPIVMLRRAMKWEDEVITADIPKEDIVSDEELGI